MSLRILPFGALPIALFALAWTPLCAQTSQGSAAVPLQQAAPMGPLPPPSPATKSSVEAAPDLDATLDSSTKEMLDKALTQPIPELDNDRLNALWFQSLLSNGQPTAILTELETASQPEAPHRATALWIRAGILAREGRTKEAVGHYKDLVDVVGDLGLGGTEARFERARLEDMRGKQKIARNTYTNLVRDLAKEGSHAQLAQRLRLRLALLDKKKTDQAGQELADLAREGDDDTMRRAAVVLGLSGLPQEAIRLFPRDAISDEPNTGTFRQEARLAEWALQANDLVRAQSLAWDAVQSAKLRRDRNYALTLVVEAYRADDSLELLIDRIADSDAKLAKADAKLNGETLDIWIEILRETGRVDEAIALFEERGADMQQERRSALIEMYREGGRTDELVSTLQREIQKEPKNLAWRAALSRFFLERGDHKAATLVWDDFVGIDSTNFGDEALLVGFHMLTDQGLDELATQVAERAIKTGGQNALAACLLLFGMHQERGDLVAAEADLERMEALAAPNAPERLDLAEAWERLGRLDKAVNVLERVVASRGVAGAGEDLAMHLAWLYSEVGDEKRALVEWRALWLRVNAIARRRYVEDRMMTVAARLGSLADIAFDIEKKLYKGAANEREAGLLVRLYTKVQDAVSATEVLEEYLTSQSTGVTDETTEEARQRQVAALEEKGRVYLACLDYFHFEKTVRSLIEVDPEGGPDYLRQLAMSQLERGQPDQARTSLTQLRSLEEASGDGGGDAAEFEAGVLALAGLRDEAIDAYRIGIASNPNRIESWLLFGNLMKESGQGQRAIRMFQQLAETADADDLFMIAVDGLLNLEAPEPVLKWARRATWERLASRSDKAYLYQLSADLSDAANDNAGVLVALESSLSIAGERRGSILRELIGRTTNNRGFDNQSKDDIKAKKLAFSRRLLGLGEIVPPDVYLNLGKSFLEAKDPDGAERTFSKATDVPDRGSFQRETAKLFEERGYAEKALNVYERALSSSPTNAGLLIKVGELQERLGNDSVAHELYARSVELLLSRMPLTSTKEDKRAKKTGAFSYWGARNIDDFDRFFTRAQLGFEVTLKQEQLTGVIDKALDRTRIDLLAALETSGEPPTELAHAPKALHRSRFGRELALAAGRPDLVLDFDLWLLDEALPKDESLLEALLLARLERGQVAAARTLLDRTKRGVKETGPLRFRVGQGAEDNLPKRLTLDQTRSLILPLIIEGNNADIALLLARTDLIGLKHGEIDRIGLLLNAAMFIGNGDLSLRLGREWIRLLFEAGTSEWQIRPVLDRLETVLKDEEFRGLCMYLAEKALDDPDKGQAIMGYLPTLAKKLGIELFTSDQLFELLDAKEDLGYGYGMESVLSLFAAAEQPSALRSMLPRLRPTARAGFLITIIGSQKKQLTEALGEVITDSFPVYLDEADDGLKWSIRSLGSTEYNREIRLSMVRALLEKDPETATALVTEVELLWELDHKAESLELARTAWPKLNSANDSDWVAKNARSQLQRFLGEHDLETLLGMLKTKFAEDPQQSAIQRAQLLFTRDRKQEATELLASAAAAQIQNDPEVASKLLQTLAGYQSSMGGQLVRLETLSQALELTPEDEALRRTLVKSWQALWQPARALNFAEGLVPEDEPDQSELKQFAGLNLTPGTIIIINGKVVKAGTGDDDKDTPTIARVKQAASEGRDADAELLLRRLWRRFRSGVNQTNRYGGMFGSNRGTPVWTWPEDKDDKQEDAENEALAETPLSQAGLIDYSEPVIKEVKPSVSAYNRLAGFDWGRREMKRILFTRTAQALDTDGTRQLIDGLLASRSGEPAEAVRDELLDRIKSGLAGKAEHIMLLSFLDTHPELVDSRSEAVLDDLARTLQTGDFGPLRALARLYARRGDHEEATRLYRWLATKVAALGAWYNDEEARIDARKLFKEVHEVLGQEDVNPELLINVAADIVFFATAGSDSWSRDQQDRFALEVWAKVLPPAQALERLSRLTDSISNTRFEKGPPRGVAASALALYLKAGQIDRALVCLEVALCTFERSLFEDQGYIWPSPSSPGAFSAQDLAAWFPSQTADFPNASEWYQAASKALLEWHATGRISGYVAARGVALATWRGSKNGMSFKPEALSALIETCLAQPANAAKRQWSRNKQIKDSAPDPITSSGALDLIDAARWTGLTELGDRLEAYLLETDRFPFGRIPALIQRTLVTKGPAPALLLGERYLSTYHHSDLVETMREAAIQFGATTRAEQLEALASSEQAARLKLAELEPK